MMAYVSGAVALGSLGVFVTFAALGKAKENDLRDRCSPHCSPAALGPMKTDYAVAYYAALPLTVVALGVTAVLLMTKPAAKP